jgi:hypothetical protein
MKIRTRFHATKSILRKLAVTAFVVTALTGCDEGDRMPRVSSPDWSEPQMRGSIEVRGRLAMTATDFEPVAQVRLVNTGSNAVTLSVPSDACAIQLAGFADYTTSAAIWEPHSPHCAEEPARELHLAPEEVEVLTSAVPVTPELHSTLRRYQWILIRGR